MSSTDPQWHGEDRRVNPNMKMYGGRRKDDSIHPYRWMALTIWIVVFSVIVGFGMGQLSRQTDDLEANKATLKSLQKTNCALVNFLLAARKARWDAYKGNLKTAKAIDNPEGKKALEASAHNNLEAVISYENLIAPFSLSSGTCPIPEKVKIPERPLR